MEYFCHVKNNNIYTNKELKFCQAPSEMTDKLTLVTIRHTFKDIDFQQLRDYKYNKSTSNAEAEEEAVRLSHD